MTRHGGKRSGNVNRLLLRRWTPGQTEDRLWDRSGRQWSPAVEGLSEQATKDLYFDNAVQVAIYESAGTMRWIDPDDRAAAWPAIRARAFDETWTPPSGAPGALPYEAQEWRNGDDRLLLFDDHD